MKRNIIMPLRSFKIIIFFFVFFVNVRLRAQEPEGYHIAAKKVDEIFTNLDKGHSIRFFLLGCYSKSGELRIQKIIEGEREITYIVDSFSVGSDSFARRVKKVDKNKMRWLLDFRPDVKKLNSVSSQRQLSSPIEGPYLVFGYREQGSEYQDVRIPAPVITLGKDGKMFEDIYQFFQRMEDELYGKESTK